MTDKVLSRMAMFDFSAPVKTVMVFEDDSDDEKLPSLPKKKKNYNSITTYNLHHEVDITSSSDEDIKTEDIIQYKDNLTADNREKSSRYKPKQTNKEVSEPDQQNAVKSHTLQNEENVVSSNIVDDKSGNIVDDRICSEQQKLQNEIPTPSAKTGNASEKSIPDQVNTVTSFTNSNQSNDIAIMSGYLKKLINAVSDHLLKILEAYRLYVSEQNTNNPIILERSRIHYIQVKHHFFKLSFMIVETIFIPQVHSYTFARNFIECTVRIAKKKSMTYSYEEIEPLYLEMLEWAKVKSRDFKKISLSYMTSKWHHMTQLNNTSTELPKQNAPNLNAHYKTLPVQSNNTHAEVTNQSIPNLNSHNKTLSRQSLKTPTEGTKQLVPNLNAYNQTLSMQSNNIPIEVTKQLVPNFNAYNQALSLQSNNIPTEMTKQHVPNLNAHNKTLSRNKTVNITSGLQRNESVSNQLLHQHPILQSDLSRPSLPNYESAVNLQRSSVVDSQNFLYSNCQSQNNYETIHHHYSSSSYAYNNNLSNARLRGSTCLTNGPCVFQNCGRCHQIQFNNGIPQQNITIPSISPATSLDTNNYSYNISSSPNTYSGLDRL